MPSLPPKKQFIVVPFYPERNDMVLVLGDNDVQWIGKIVSVQSDEKKLECYFIKNIQDGLEAINLSKKVQLSIVSTGIV